MIISKFRFWLLIVGDKELWDGEGHTGDFYIPCNVFFFLSLDYGFNFIILKLYIHILLFFICIILCLCTMYEVLQFKKIKGVDVAFLVL